MKGTIVPKVHCMGCGCAMMQEIIPDTTSHSIRNYDSERPEKWLIYCVVQGCPNEGRRFKQPTSTVELEEV